MSRISEPADGGVVRLSIPGRLVAFFERNDTLAVPFGLQEGRPEARWFRADPASNPEHKPIEWTAIRDEIAKGVDVQVFVPQFDCPATWVTDYASGPCERTDGHPVTHRCARTDPHYHDHDRVDSWSYVGPVHVCRCGAFEDDPRDLLTEGKTLARESR